MHSPRGNRGKRSLDDGKPSDILSVQQDAPDLTQYRPRWFSGRDRGDDRTTTSAALETSGTITTAAVTPTFDPSVVQIINTTQFSKPCADPAGLTYIPGTTPGTGRLLLSDSEIDETPFFRPDNIFYLSETGAFDHSASFQSFCKEPTGIAFNPLNGLLYISDDNKDMVFEVDPDDPNVLISSFSTRDFGSDDAEDILFDPVTGHLIVSEGEQSSDNPRTLFVVNVDGDLIDSIQLPAAVGDPEGVAYDAERNVFYVGGNRDDLIYVVSRTGQIVDILDILEDHRNEISDTRTRPKAMTMAPSSDPNDDPSVMSLWVGDYGKDQFMDGRILEIQLAPTSSSSPPLFTSSSDIVDFADVVAGEYQAGTQYNALAGNDTVTLPVNAAAAAAAGFDSTKTFNGDDGHDTITGGALNESIGGGGGNDVVHGGDGNDTLTGGNNADLLSGGAGNDSLDGSGSSDTLIGGLGNDTLNGGSSNDTVDYSAAAGPVTVNLALGTATGEGNDTLFNVENATGSALGDTITGSNVANVLIGGGGGDTLFGGDGNDKLTGGTGTDQAFGGNGHDTLKWDSADLLDGGAGFDTLDAILGSADTIDLRDANFANLERIRTGSGKDVVTLSLNDVLADTLDNQFVADLGSSSPDTLNIDAAGGWNVTTTNSTLGPTGVAAGISVSGMTAHTYTNGVDTVTVFTNAEVVNEQGLIA